MSNAYYAAKKSLLASNNSAADVGRYWDDEDVSSDVLSIYLTTVTPIYLSYVTGMKQATCARTWVAGNGDCVPPMLA